MSLHDSLLNESVFSRNSLLKDTTFENDFPILEEMGYNSNMIKKVYAFLKPQDISQAINYMTKENGIYFHNFFKDYKHKNRKTCYICGKLKQYHSDFLPPEFVGNLNDNDDIDDNDIYNNENDKNENIKIDEINDNDFICRICNDSYKSGSKDIISYNKCGDEYCIHCWFSYLRTKIEEGFVGNIKCMNFSCKEILDDKFIRNLIKTDNKLLKKYESFLIKNEILNNPNKKFCPYKNCDSYGEKIGKDKYIKCKNGHKFCFICLKEWHGNKPCEKKEDEEINKWKKDKILKKCPNCKIWTEKNEGCNHMTCAECKYQWCWLCGGKYSYNHFYEGKCNGLQFFKPKSEEDIENALAKNINNNKNNNNLNNNRNNFNNTYRYPIFVIDEHILVRERSWKQPQGLINFRYYDPFNLIDPNNPLFTFNRLNVFEKFIHFIIFIIGSFNIMGLRYFEDKIFPLRHYYQNTMQCFFILIVLFIFPIFSIFNFYVNIIIISPSFFYFPFLKKIWIIYWIRVIRNQSYLC